MALSADAQFEHMISDHTTYPVAASATIYAGGMVGDNGSGYARALEAGDPFRGHAIRQADNSDGSAGDIDVSVWCGTYRAEVTLTSVAITDVGKDVYASADDTYTLTQGSNSRVGKVHSYITTNQCVIEFEPVAGSSDIANHEHTSTIDGGLLTSPHISTSIQDSNGLDIVTLTATGSAVNEVGIANAATGKNPTISCQGEANTGIDFENSEGEEILILDSVATSVNEITIASAGTGANPTIAATGEADTGIDFENKDGEEILILDSVASSVNELTIKSAATGNKPIIAATGEADTGIEFHNDQAEEILILASAATSVNEVTITSAASGSDPTIAATGGDTDIDLVLAAKGSGVVDGGSTFEADAYTVGGVAGCDFGSAAPALITVVKGIVTAASS